MKWTAIDFETANEKRSSACQLGIVTVDGEEAQRRSWLIRPSELYFNPYNVFIHGITEADVEDEPELDALWPEILPYLEGRIVVAHSASFDISVLRSALDEYAISYPTFDYFCTRVFAKKIWPGLISYGLETVADHLGIDFSHHDAEEDAVACAQIALRCCVEAGCNSLTEVADKHEIITGRLYPGGYRPSGVKAKTWHIGDIKPTVEEFDRAHPFHDRTLVFTGTLQSIKRQDAMQKVVDHGGRCTNTVSKKTHFLVVGDQDFRMFRGGDKSAKMRKAEAILADGGEIEMIAEDEFLRMLDA